MKVQYSRNWDETNVILRRKFIEIQAYLKKQKMSETI